MRPFFETDETAYQGRRYEERERTRYKVGDIIRVGPAHQGEHNKYANDGWEGVYKVCQVFANNEYRLARMVNGEFDDTKGTWDLIVYAARFSLIG